MHEFLKELEQAFESGGTSPKVFVPEPLVPLSYPSSEENLIYILWYTFDYVSRQVGSRVKHVVGEADLGAYGRPDLVLYVDDDVWCIEVKERIRDLSGREVGQLLRYAECPYIDFLVVAYFKWCREDDDLTKTKIQYLLDRGIGVFYITPFGKIVFDENYAPYKLRDRHVEMPIFSRYEEKLRYLVYKYFISKGFGVTLETPLRDLETTYYTHSLISYERPRAIHRLPRIDLVVWDRKEDVNKLRFVGIEVKTGREIDIQQIENYRRSAMLSELYIAVPTPYVADVEQILRQYNLDDVGVIAIDERNEKVEVVREAEAKNTTYKYYKYVQIKDGCLIVEDPFNRYKVKLPRITPTEALYFGLWRW